MKKLPIILILFMLSTIFAYGQDDSAIVDAPLGLRIKRNGQDYLIYSDQNLAPNLSDYRKINYQVYFRKVDAPIKVVDGKKYQMITIPGSSGKQDQNKIEKLVDGSITYPRAGQTVNKEDYDHNFWIDIELTEKQTDPEYYKYANDVFSGLLTAPFKYRLKQGNAPESLIDGDFNVAPFIGWKWRVSSVRSYYIAPFGFAGITTLNFNSANNSKITNSDKLENGVGVTYGLGLSVRLGNVSPGFVIGWDRGFGDTGSGFLYNDKPWISFSVNYDFFKSKKNSEGEQK